MRPLSIFENRPIATGAAVAAVSLVPHLLISPQLSSAYAAILLGAVAGVYFGFAVMAGTPRKQWTELFVAAGFGVSALAGFAGTPWMMPAAYVAHAVSDVLHHEGSDLGLVEIPPWYVPWCATMDILIAMGLIAIWHWRGVL